MPREKDNIALSDEHNFNTTNAARFFVGLVVWQPGELEAELQRDFWFVMKGDSEMVFRKSTDGLWEELVRKSRDML